MTASGGVVSSTHIWPHRSKVRKPRPEGPDSSLRARRASSDAPKINGESPFREAVWRHPRIQSTSDLQQNLYMKPSLLIFALLLAACTASPVLEEGRWTGSLTPMNHPEMTNPVAYEVRHLEGSLSIDLIGPSGKRMATQRPRLRGDTLLFAFEEPEEQVQLGCALGRAAAGFAGRCVDSGDKWARFTREPPA